MKYRIWWIQWCEGDYNTISIGRKAPWMNRIQIRMPRYICAKWNKFNIIKKPIY